MAPTARFRVFLAIVTASLSACLSCESFAGEIEHPATAPAPSVPATRPARASADLDLQLINASGSQNVARVKALLDEGADVNARGGEALYRAACRERVEIAKLLIAHGAKAQAQCIAGWTALHWAAARGHADLVDLILDSGAPVNPLVGPSALSVAASRGQAQVVILLLGRGADAKARSDGGSTALHAAAFSGDVFTIQLLIGGGADVNARDNNGNTPLIEAIESHEKDAAVFLLSSGADINSKDNAGKSVLTRARQTGTKELVDMLLERGAKE
jgi:ankyrin repeat protein